MRALKRRIVRSPDLMYVFLNKLIAALSPAGIEPTFKV
jgi:hypothetical protein